MDRQDVLLYRMREQREWFKQATKKEEREY
jgi:hypothetical protein